MTWIRVEANAGRNDKVHTLAARLRISQAAALGHLVMVWGGLAEFRVDGDLNGVLDHTLEAWAQWGGRRGRFSGEFRRLFVGSDGRVTGWADRQGKLIERAAAERARKVRGRSAETPPLRNDTVRDSTTTTSPPAADVTAELYRELPSEYVPTLEGILRAARQPWATAAAIRALGPGGIHEAYPWAIIGRALFELAGHADPQFTAARLTAFCRRLADPPTRPGPNGQPLTPGDEARALAATLERQERSA